MLETHPGVLGAVLGNGTGELHCHCKTKRGVKKAQNDGNLLDSSAVLAHASRADLQTTIMQLEQTRASLVAAPEAAIVVRSRMEALKTEVYTRDPMCVQMSKLHGAIERRSRSMPRKRHWPKTQQPWPVRRTTTETWWTGARLLLPEKKGAGLV